MTKVILGRLLFGLKCNLLFLYHKIRKKKGGNTMRVIEINDLYKTFKNKVALKGLSLTVDEGEIFGLLGPNGAGKSTLINILSMLLEKDKGEVKIWGYDMKENVMGIKEKIGVIPQDLAIFETLSAYENVKFFGSLYGFKGKELEEKVLEALAFVGLEERKKDKAKTFSGGMKRRLNIACGIVHKPKLIIMDEPTVGIDPQSRNYILESIKKLNKEGSTIIYTTHYMEEAESLCERIAIIDRGSVIAIGTRNELEALIDDKTTVQIGIKAVETVDETVLASIKGVEKIKFEGNTVTIVSRKEVTNLDKIIGKLVEGGTQITSVQTKKLDLEDVFLSLTGRKLRD